MAITDKKTGVWGLDQTFNKINQGSIWTYSGENTLWSWGQNEKGELGHNNETDRSSPVQVGSDTNWSGQAYAISGGEYYIHAIKEI